MMAHGVALLEAADLMRRAASLLEISATGREIGDRAPRLRGLKCQIDALLDDGRAMTSREIADALYAPSFGVHRELFKRRLTVTLSSMHKKDGTLKRTFGCTGDTLKWRKITTQL